MCALISSPVYVSKYKLSTCIHKIYIIVIIIQINYVTVTILCKYILAWTCKQACCLIPDVPVRVTVTDG